MHPSVALMLRNPQNRATAAHILARQGNRGDSMLAHINPAEAMMLKQVGGSGTINPKTGIRQFDPTGGSNAGGAGHAGDSGNNGGKGGGGGNANSGGTGAIGGGGGFGPGHANAPSSGSGGYTGTHASGPGFGSGPTNSPSGGYGQYGSDGGYNGGVTVNPGRSIASFGLGLIPGVGPILSGLNSAFGPTIGPSFNFGGTTNGYAIDGSKTGVYGMDQGGNYSGHPGANGGGQHDGGGWGAGSGPGGPGAPGATPAPATPPAGLPPAALQALAGLYAQGAQSDPFGGRFGKMPVTSPYLVAGNQPQGQGYLTGLIGG